MIDEKTDTSPDSKADLGDENKTEEQIWDEIIVEEAKASTDVAADGADADDEPGNTADADDAAAKAELNAGQGRFGSRC